MPIPDRSKTEGFLLQAREHHRLGRLDQALAVFQAVLQREPAHTEALYNLGMLEKERGDLEAATAHFKKALQLQPDLVPAYNSLGNILRERGLYEQAIDQFRTAILVNPKSAVGHYNLAGALKDAGRIEEAIESYRLAIRLKPDLHQAYTNLAHIYFSQSDYTSTIAIYDQAIRVSPRSAALYRNKAVALQEMQCLDEAAECLNEAVALAAEPSHEYPDLYNNLALRYFEQGKIDKAVELLHSAIRLNPENAHAYSNLGLVFKSQGNNGAALECHEKAIKINPSLAEACCNAAIIYEDMGREKEALSSYKKSIDIKSDYVEAMTRLLFLQRRICQWDNLDNLAARIVEVFEDSKGVVPPFPLLSIKTTPKLQFNAARIFAESNFGGLSRSGKSILPPSPHTEKDRITIGYLSPDFRQHAVSYLTAELFERHDRKRFSINAYSYGPDDGSSLRCRLTKGFDKFVDVGADTFVESAQRIRNDGVDILVDLAGYTRMNRAQILALRPAPLQVSYLGYIGTMGADFMDYIIADPFVVPEDQQEYYSEKLVHMPECYQVTDSKRPISEHVPDRESCGLPENGFVFCGFNNSYKITPDVFSIWMRLLQKVPDSVLWLSKSNRHVVENLRREAVARGVDADRLVFAETMSSEDYLALFRNADLFLDTSPYNAGTTASDALWGGCPVLTCPGDTFASRMAGSLLRAAGLPELVTGSVDDYENLALRLSQNREELTILRERLQANRGTAPLFDCPRFVLHLESAFEQMWDRYLAGERPDPIKIPALPGGHYS